jgi:pyridinium-3,5-biscarboxylic acid mononucleotide sulfurtransferase
MMERRSRSAGRSEARKAMSRQAKSHEHSTPVVERLRDALGEHDRAVVAFSGGVDSGLLAYVATETLGADRVLCATAVSPSLAADERAACRELASDWGLRWQEVTTEEMANAAYRVNDGDRCFWCKDALMDVLVPLADQTSATVLLGVNTDDLGDHRPGQEAARQRGARFPLVEAGLTKADVRATAKALGLAVWDKPAAPCLASRLPYGTEVSVGVLGQVERAEAAVRRLGFGDLRVRHTDDTARLEVPLVDLDRVLARRDEVVAAVHAAGYRYVTLDLDGLRSGNLNAALHLDGPAS